MAFQIGEHFFYPHATLIKKECGFRIATKDYDWDLAISFAGEHRELAKEIVEQLEVLDCSIFFDENYEANFLGRAWRETFKKIFADQCRFVICLLDKHHDKKIWPTFERECFSIRVKDGEVIPIFLDDTVFVGISRDIIGIPFSYSPPPDKNRVTDEIVWKITERLGMP